MIKHLSKVILILILLLSYHCDQSVEKGYDDNFIREYNITKIDLMGELSDRSSEISGLCWFGNKLIILPQYPQRFGDESGKIFFIERAKLKKYIEGDIRTPIEPSSYNIDLSNVGKYFNMGSGFEAISVIDTTAFFTVEYLSSVNTETLLIRGAIDTSAREIFIDEKSIVSDPTDLRIYNMSCESILAMNDHLYPIFEANGKNVIDSPKVSVFNNNLQFKNKIDFPTVEYRITDVTNPDDSGKFWGINYF
ncbi:MAG: hypothetical protein R3250_10200, partial [Melioribacteraceae bacterium]|nr:hypothetical protein [Melioribacteraceae bacterium]